MRISDHHISLDSGSSTFKILSSNLTDRALIDPPKNIKPLKVYKMFPELKVKMFLTDLNYKSWRKLGHC